MVSVDRKTLFGSRGRLATSVGGVAFSVLLVLFLLGVYNGFLAGTAAFIEGSGADVWVAQEGAVDIFHSRSLLPEDPRNLVTGHFAPKGLDIVVTAREASAFAAKSSASIRELFIPLLLSVTAIGFLTAAAVISITSWSAVNERVADFGVLKAIGAENRFIHRIVFLQSAFSSVAGFVVGVPLYLAASRLLHGYRPAVMFSDEPVQFALVLFGILLAGAAASYLPVRRIARIDPADVFRGA